MEQIVFKSVKGSVTIDGAQGSHTFSFEGAKPPQQLGGIPKYVGECVQRSLIGADDSEVIGLKKRISELEALVDEKNAQIKAKAERVR